MNASAAGPRDVRIHPHRCRDRAGRAWHASQLLPLVYDELRKLAAQRLAQEQPDQTLQATALVHEAYIRLVGEGPKKPWDGRGHFFAAAAEAMRRILVDRARSRRRQKRGGTRRRVRIDLDSILRESLGDDLPALDEVLHVRGRAIQPGPSSYVFVRLSVSEIASPRIGYL